MSGRSDTDTGEDLPRLAFAGPIESLDPRAEARLFDRGRATDPAVAEAVARIIADVRRDGDAALRALAARLDDVSDLAIEVPREECERALEHLDGRVRAALEEAARAIAAFHRAQLPSPLELEIRQGVRLGRTAEPLGRVGVYAPGGRAAYPSSVLMGVVPARVAGVEEVIVCSPPGPDGRPPQAVLAACALAGADRVFALGGAGAIAALAFGTATVPRVDKVVGPGNAYVTEAKRQLTGEVAIDCPAGPSEILVLADATADADTIAIEMIAQAEHDPDAAAVLVTTEPGHFRTVCAALAARLGEHPRRDIVEQALAARGALLLAADLAEAVELAGRYAPEHLLLLVEDPRAVLETTRRAGTTFLGPASSVAFGDYISGANHVLPTAGLARAYSGLSTLDFIRWSTWQEISADAAAELAEPAATLADAEGLPGHAAAARHRRRSGEEAGTAWAVPDGTTDAGRPAVRRRAAYRGVRTYDPGRVPTAVDLSDNTNLWGVPPAAAEALASLSAAVITRYPSVYAQSLERAVASRLDVDPENVVTGCGSDDVIDSALRAFCEPGDPVAYPVPTFGVVRSFVQMNAAVPVEVPLGPDFALDADALVATGATATYVCLPNNPTGTAFERTAVERVVREARGLVMIDEAYADFADANVLATVMASDRAVSLRTLSKAWGLAGLRIGLAVGPADLITEIRKSRGPYKVSGPAEAAALAALERDGDWVAARVAEVRENRERLAAALCERGLRVWPSAANFLLASVPAEHGDAAALAGSLRRAGVQVRPFAALPQAGDAIRVSIGPWPMLESFLRAFDGCTRRSAVTPTTGAVS